MGCVGPSPHFFLGRAGPSPVKKIYNKKIKIKGRKIKNKKMCMYG
jgi:hypothetical protein